MTDSKANFLSTDVEILEREKIYNAFLQVDRIGLKHRLYEGGWSNRIVRELSVRDEAVGVLLFDPADNKIVLVRQFRIGAINDEASPWLLELVAGMVGNNEELEDVARRETQEESNCQIIELIKICDYYSSPGVSDEKVTLFCGKVDASNAGGIYGLAEENEDIEVVVMSYDDAQEALNSGAINNAMSIIALQWLAFNKKTLQDAWN
jgi:ADP-ribose pyrophosphatase